jgi:long-chain acyl-CoA synthetase
MKGYYKDPEATGKAVRHGWFHTGDLATVDRDGYIYITGRASSIIKSAGYRVSPFEIEKVIMSLDEVAGCAVMGIGDEIMGEAIVAVVQPRHPDGERLKNDIITLCNRTLPSYKVPRHVLELAADELPRTPSGKVRKDELRRLVDHRLPTGDLP